MIDNQKFEIIEGVRKMVFTQCGISRLGDFRLLDKFGIYNFENKREYHLIRPETYEDNFC